MVGGGKDREEMSDLISRAEVMNIIQEELSLRCGHEADIALFSVKKKVSELPTAFDTERVVEQLSCNSRFIDDINEHNIKCISCVIGQKTAIDIVKKGGVE